MAGTLASLEDRLRKLINAVTVGDVIIVDDADLPAIARMLEGKLGQGDEPLDAVVTTVNFYSSRLETNTEGAGIAAIVGTLEEWWNEEPAAGRSPDEEVEIRTRVTQEIRDIFEAGYEGAYEGDWLDVDTNDFDLDPCGYLEEIAFHFGVEMPPYGSNRELVEFVVARL